MAKLTQNGYGLPNLTTSAVSGTEERTRPGPPLVSEEFRSRKKEKIGTSAAEAAVASLRKLQLTPRAF